MELNPKIINCPKCGKKLLEPPEIREYDLYCENCKIRISAKPEFEWVLWVIFKEVKKEV